LANVSKIVLGDPKNVLKKAFNNLLKNVSKLVPGDHGLLRGQD